MSRRTGNDGVATAVSPQKKEAGSMEVTYYVAIPFDRDPEGDLKPGEAQELPTAGAAERRAAAMALEHVGALAFARAGDPSIGEFRDATLLVRFGEVDLDALGA
jgi:hypothetical protein